MAAIGEGSAGAYYDAAVWKSIVVLVGDHDAFLYQSDNSN